MNFSSLSCTYASVRATPVGILHGDKKVVKKETCVSVPNLCLLPPRLWKSEEEIYPEVVLWNLITDRPSDSHPICPRRGTYLFPASDCIKFVLFLTLLGGKKKTCLADSRYTLVAAGSQKHFIYVWMAVGAQFCLASTVCCGLWHLFASILSPWHTLLPISTGPP